MVRDLKAAGAPEIDVKKAVNELKARKKILEDKELELRYAGAIVLTILFMAKLVWLSKSVHLSSGRKARRKLFKTLLTIL